MCRASARSSAYAMTTVVSWRIGAAFVANVLTVR
jgi:hypothetical protein